MSTAATRSEGEGVFPRQTLLVLLAMLGAAIATGLAVYSYDRSRVIETSFTRLTLFHGLRRATLEDYMRSKASDVRAMSRNQHVVEAFAQLNEAWKELGVQPAQTARRLYLQDNPFDAEKRSFLRDAGDGSRYSEAHQGFHDWARGFLDHFGYYDMFLIDREGNIIYTVRKEDDFATNLLDGPYDDSALGYVFQQAIKLGAKRITISDFERYKPSNGLPAVFAANAITGKDAEAIGVFAVQLRQEPIDEILRYTPGMGETGETYIVGNDFLMRSQSRFLTEPTMLTTEVDTESVRQALAGFSGSLNGRNYRGVPVLSIYSGLDFGGPPWVLLAEMSEREVLRQIPRWRSILSALGAALVVGLLGKMVVRIHGGG